MTVIIALCAIISPIFVSIINNRHQLKMKQLEITKDHKIQAFEKYLSSLEKCVKEKRNSALNSYGEAFGNALLYASSSTQALMIEIDDFVTLNSYNNWEIQIDQKLIQKVCKKLQTDMNIY